MTMMKMYCLALLKDACYCLVIYGYFLNNLVIFITIFNAVVIIITTSGSALIPIIVAITAAFSRTTHSTSIRAINFKSLSIFLVV